MKWVLYKVKDYGEDDIYYLAACRYAANFLIFLLSFQAVFYLRIRRTSSCQIEQVNQQDMYHFFWDFQHFPSACHLLFGKFFFLISSVRFARKMSKISNKCLDRSKKIFGLGSARTRNFETRLGSDSKILGSIQP